jgi:hypothetical protein
MIYFMSSDHAHNWHIIEERELPDDRRVTLPDQPRVTFKVERCSWCGERREYRDSGRYDP